MPIDLRALIEPKTVAVIGASRSPEKVGAIALKNILESGFTGTIYPINPNSEEISGLKCYPDIASLPEIVDVGVIALPTELAIESLKNLGEKGVKNAVIFTAGFKEIGPAGEILEEQLKAIANQYQINIIGPNCLGFANNDLPINITFGRIVKQSGNLRVISQSGALATSLFDWCQASNLGFSQFITIGNKTVINENHLLEYFEANPGSKNTSPGMSDVHPIGLYLESISDGREFIKIASKITSKNPIFILKPGKSKAAAQSMRSHTGSIAGADSVLDIALKEAGVIRCHELGDFFDLARGFAWEKCPSGPRVAVISNAGGPAVLSTDTISEVGLELADLSQDARGKLSDFLPRMASFLNPIDVLGDALADRFGQALEIVLQESSVDSVVVILTPQLMTQIAKTAEIISDLSKKYHQPIMCSFIGGGLTAEGESILNNNRIPSFPFPERAIKTLAAMYHWHLFKNRAQDNDIVCQIPAPDISSAKSIIISAQSKNLPGLDGFEGESLLRSVGIPTPQSQIVVDENEASIFGEENSFPILIKAASPNLLHKAEIGGVVANLNDRDSVVREWHALWQRIDSKASDIKPSIRIQAQKQIPVSHELIVGVKRDPTFGNVVLFGAGGKLAELIQDRNLALGPLTETKARTLIEKSKAFKLLSGFRGEEPFDLNPIVDVLIKLSSLADSCPSIKEIEINPLIVNRDGVSAVDVKTIFTDTKETMPGPKFKNATVITHKTLASTFHYFLLKPDEPLSFTAGQFISIKVSDTKLNSYSIAGQTPDKNIELIIDTAPGGVGSQFFEKVVEGQKLEFLGSFGCFTYKEDDSENLVFLATGSGISPLRAMIHDLLANNKTSKPITLYFGMRFQADIILREEFESLAAAHPNFNFKLCLSRPEPDWTGLHGHITDILNQDYPDKTKISAYICGGKSMVEESNKILLEGGCPEKHIYQEKY